MAKKTRRGHGEGSVYRRSDGRWVAAIDLGWIDGKRRRKTVYGATEREVLDKRDALRNQQTRGVNVAAAPRTVAEWLAEWLGDSKPGEGTSLSTLARYEQIARVHLVPSLGSIRLSALTPRHVQVLMTRLRSELAPATVIKVHGVLRNALGDAERMDLIGRNVAKAVRSGSLPRSERRALTPAEATALLAELTGDRLEAVFVLAIATGLRRGEVLGLRWADVDLDERVLFVRQTLQRSAGALRFVAPKTHRSARSVPIPAFAVRALQNHRAGQATERLALGSAWQDSGLVFTTQLGTRIEPRNVNRRFDAARRAAVACQHDGTIGLPRARDHRSGMMMVICSPVLVKRDALVGRAAWC